MDIDEEFYKPDHSGDFERPFMWAFIGGYLGYLLSLTRFGRWFENSPVIGFIYFSVVIAILGYLIFCVISFVVILLGIMLG